MEMNEWEWGRESLKLWCPGASQPARQKRQKWTDGQALASPLCLPPRSVAGGGATRKACDLS